MAIDPPAADAAEPCPAHPTAEPGHPGTPEPDGDDQPGEEPGSVGGKHYEPL